MKIELKKREGKDDRHFVTVDGIPDSNSIVYTTGEAFIFNEDVIDILLKQTFLQLAEHFVIVNFVRSIDSHDSYHVAIVSDIISPYIELTFVYNFGYWAKAWSIYDFATEFIQTLQELNYPNVSFRCDDEDLIYNAFGAKYTVRDINSVTGDEFHLFADIFEEIISSTNNRLLQNLNKDSLVTYFDFPKEIQSTCGQYLIYFSQFLADVGIEANTEIKEEANQTLFKVTPIDKSQALSKIHVALKIFLNASGYNLESNNSSDDSIEIMRLKSNIHHHQSQLLLTKSIIQAKDASIDALNISNYQLREMVKTLEKDKLKEEELIPGYISVGQYKEKGITINFHNMFRDLKKLFESKEIKNEEEQ